MFDDSAYLISKPQRIAAWLVHLFTASGAILGVLSLWAIHEGRYIQSFWLMAAAVFIDSVDGTLARRAKQKWLRPKLMARCWIILSIISPMYWSLLFYSGNRFAAAWLGAHRR